MKQGASDVLGILAKRNVRAGAAAALCAGRTALCLAAVKTN